MKIKNLKLFQSTLHHTPYTLLRLTTIFSMGVGSIIHKVSQYSTEVWCLISISKLTYTIWSIVYTYKIHPLICMCA